MEELKSQHEENKLRSIRATDTKELQQPGNPTLTARRHNGILRSASHSVPAKAEFDLQRQAREKLRNDEKSQIQVEGDRETYRGYGGGGGPFDSPPSSPNPSTISSLSSSHGSSSTNEKSDESKGKKKRGKKKSSESKSKDKTGTFVKVPLTPKAMKDKITNASACAGLTGKIYKTEDDTTFQSDIVQQVLKIAHRDEVNFFTAKDLMSNIESYLRIHGAIPSDDFSSLDKTTDAKTETKHTIESVINHRTANAEKSKGTRSKMQSVLDIIKLQLPPLIK